MMPPATMKAAIAMHDHAAIALAPLWMVLIGGGIAALIAGSLGCFVVWRRMAYFGDSLAHSALLGLALGLWLQVSETLSVMVVFAAFALFIGWLQNRRLLSNDTLLGMLSQGALASGMVLLSLKGQHIDVHDYLFGDLFAITPRQLLWAAGGGALILLLLTRLWPSLVLLSLNEDLARAEGVKVERLQWLFMLLLTLTVALAVPLFGILLITAMLIIPAASARLIARSPIEMAAYAASFGVIAMIIGSLLARHYHTTSGATIVCVALALFGIILTWQQTNSR